ncbi:MAG: hypothetical protein KDA85_03460 [Planctomycetaceae bacterium]|nr:hypothetical protein [Planctomycetaceae bacterium]
MKTSTDVSPARLSEISLWIPPDDVRHHDGTEIPLQTCFFAEPPAAIGRVKSASSTLHVGSKPIHPVMKVIFTAGLLVALAAGTCWMTNESTPWCIVSILFPIILFPVLFLYHFDHRCSFVGELGVALFEYRSLSRKVQLKTLIPFSDYAVLYAEHLNSTGSCSARLEWFDAGMHSRKFLSVESTVLDFTRTTRDQRQLLRAAEQQWANHLAPQLIELWKFKHELQFPLRPDGLLRIADDHIMMERKRTRHSMLTTDLDRIILNDGTFTIVSKAARFVTGIRDPERIRIPYSHVGNARALLMALEFLMSDMDKPLDA